MCYKEFILGIVVLLCWNKISASVFTSSLDCHDNPDHRRKCPLWKQKYGCSDDKMTGWFDSINNICPETCGQCGNTISISFRTVLTYLKRFKYVKIWFLKIFHTYCRFFHTFFDGFPYPRFKSKLKQVCLTLGWSSVVFALCLLL